MGIFERYAPFVQDFIYDHAWENLRGIQVAAGEAIFNTDENVLLTASTASGKTEAAFFPILTDLWENPPSSVGALYVAPLKALINDQFMRLNDLCEEADIPVWHWHGDVSSSHKQKLLKHPSGILQITPESLEALLMHRHMAVPRLFHDLRFVVIDEVHSLLRGDRGGQTLCLIERLSRMAGVNPRRIGLSATIGDPERTGAFLSSGTGRGCIIPRFEEPGRTWRLSMEHFYVTGPQAVERAEAEMSRRADGTIEADVLSVERVATGDDKKVSDTFLSPAEIVVATTSNTPDDKKVSDTVLSSDTTLAPRATDTAPENADPGIGYIFERTRGHKCLVFVNSREEAEAVCTMLRSYCEAMHEPDRFLIHHGNLSSSLRENAEDIMRDDERLDTTVTTATLELGIDIGRLERAFQIDAPFTVSSFLQRMGRTGRRGAPPEMHFVMREEQPEPRTTMPETIPWKLLQGIALVQLTREEHWVEPPRLDRLPYSLLYHQTMATLASCGELTPAELAQRVLTLSYFHRVSADDFRVLLRHLLETEQIQATEAGGLIVGLAGERITNSFKFYAVFQENEEFTVRCESAELGTIVNPPPPGERIAIAGACWLVEEVDWKRHLVYCTQVKGRVPAYFGDCAGDIDTHVLERMRRVLAEHEAYPYLLD
ncbi:DEAD/DEAH box helicase, partial [uncultured Enorma sp.]|uniref:DEAD/DEAH box helicase n=1 Tax=uncultured Enorma sp. TaxID=1714346 RepID=UPI002804C210